jgi:DtxR family Mn-dependent transcriptional regulator
MQTFCGITTDGMLDYLAAIHTLSAQNERVTTTALSERMNVSAAAVSSMLKRLEESGFIERSTIDGITLTTQGRLAALQLIRRHRLLEVFLVKVLGYTWDQVDNEAYRLEHAISSSFEDRVDQLCDFPTHCPHGDPIPRKDGSLPNDVLSIPLPTLELGRSAILRRVGSSDSRILRYLAHLGLTPGCCLRLLDIGPFNGPVTLTLHDPTAHHEAVHRAGPNAAANSIIENNSAIHPTVAYAAAPHIAPLHAAQQIIGHELAEKLYVTPL